MISKLVLATLLLVTSITLLAPQIPRLAGSILGSVLVRTSAHLLKMASSNAATADYSMAFVTVPNMEVGKKIAGGLVTNKLAACVNIIPGITSVYEWEGKIENDSELLLMIKTRSSRVPELTEFVTKNHPYDVCEVISSTIDQGNQPYLDWIGKIVPAAPGETTTTGQESK